MATFLLVVATPVSAALTYYVYRRFPSRTHSVRAELEPARRLTCTRLAVVAAILPMPFWLAHWIGTGHWLPGLLVLACFAFLAGMWVLIYLSHADGTVSDLWDLRRTEAPRAELLGRSAEPASGPTYGEPVYGTSSLPAATYVAGPTTAPGFVRHAFDEPIPVFSLFGPDLRARSQVFSPQAGQAERLALVADLAGMFRDGGAPLGSGYTAWRDGQTLYVSLLPSGYSGQRTIEVSLADGGLNAVANWAATDDAWGPVGPDEYRRVLSGWRPDRRGVNLGRERALRILDERGVAFRFPVSETDGPPQTRCGWLLDDRTSAPDYGWFRDPRLIDPSVIAWQPLHHAPTGVAVVDHLVRGSWSDEALHELHDASEVLLPGRHAIPVIGHGSRRLTVYLGVFSGYVNGLSSRDERGDTGEIYRTLDLIRAMFGHMVARERGMLLDGPVPAYGLDLPPPWAADRFGEALRAMGQEEVISPADLAHQDEYHRAEWVKLRQSENLDELRDELFGLDQLPDSDSLWRYVNAYEWRSANT